MNKLIQGDVREVIPTLGHFRCLIADPPDAIGLKYGEYDDRITDSEYEMFLMSFLALALRNADIVWLSYNAKWTFMVGSITSCLLCSFENFEAKPFVQTFTFGQNCKTDCGNGHRPIVRFRRKGTPLYPEAIKVPSWRQLNGDKRAATGGRVPLDVWDFPRITGNCKERRPHHPTQLREAMIQRMVNLSTLPGEPVLDCFSGTGTVLRAVKDRPVTSIELDSSYCQKISEEHDLPITTIPRR